MISDADLADLVVASYGTAPWDAAGMTGGIWCYLRQLKDADVVVFPGSVNLDDWIRDFRAVPEIADHPLLGPIHAGFYSGMEACIAAMTPLLQPDIPLYVTGHSLGAARAWIWTALVPQTVRTVVFGSPQPGYAKFADVLARHSVSSYRNCDAHGHDRVTDVPFAMPGLPWMQPRPLIDLKVLIPAGDTGGPFAYHHMPIYAAAVRALETP